MNGKNSDINSTPRLLQRLDTRDHLELSRLGKRCFVEKNSFAFQEGDPCDSVYLVEGGRFKISQKTPDGKNILLCCCLAGELLGLRGALWANSAQVRTYSAQACENSEILTISASRFLEYAAVQPRLALNIAQILSQRLDDVSDKLSYLTLTDTTARVARLILHCYRCYGLHGTKPMDIGVPLSQQEIADMVGVARQTISGILHAFKIQGLLSVSLKHIRIENESRLLALAYGCRSAILARSTRRRDRRTTSSISLWHGRERRAINAP